MSELNTKYQPKEIEEKQYKIAETNKFFSADENSDKPPYSIVIPPPNVTGILHIGHALNNTIQDILVRWKRMNGFEGLWLPGTDHAGIATQNVVEKKLAKENKTRHQLGREKFIEEVWDWRKQYGSTIINQLKRLGASCDWDRTRFTMDEGLSKAVREVFVKLFDDGLIYRGKRIINWCPRCGTALSDEENEPKESKGKLWHIKYVVKDSDEYIIVATTRPETMFGDTGIAVNPADERYKHLIGKKAILPLMNREIPIFADDYVDSKFGTGAVKVTPAHDPADFDMGERHNLEKIQIMDTKGYMNENVPEKYKGLERFKCRKAVVADLEEQGILLKIEEHTHNVGRCYRCATVIEPYLSDQWFVSMKKLAEPAIKAVEDGEINFYPKRWKNVYTEWMTNIRDWCISRQIWWGHRIPIWYCDDCGKVFASKTDATECVKCKSKNIRQDEDVLDTWFSSWLWPFSSMGWPENTDTLKKFYPTDTLVTAPEILFFWVARMIMAGYYCVGEKPFTDVLLHGTVRDETGRKMSKSLGNSIDPVGIIEKYGTDALRFSLIMITAQGQDVYLAENKFEMGRNFANKIWNAARFLLSNINDDDPKTTFDKKELLLEDKWIIASFNKTVDSVNKAISSYRLNEAAQLMYNFIWHDFCDWYLEVIKQRLSKDKNNISCIVAKSTGIDILAGILKLLHPIMPFITEEIWSILVKNNNIESVNIDSDYVTKSQYPKSNKDDIDTKVIENFAFLQEVIGAIRNIRGENSVAQKAKANVIIRVSDERLINLLNEHSVYLENLVNVENIVASPDAVKPEFCGSAVIKNAEIFVELEGLIDKEVELKRLEKEIARVKGILTGCEKKLSNAKFVDNAPKDIVNKEKEKKDNFAERLKKLNDNYQALAK